MFLLTLRGFWKYYKIGLRTPLKFVGILMEEKSTTFLKTPERVWGSGKIKERARLFAKDPGPKLVLGETGVGKTDLANFIHELSERTGKTIHLPCATLDGDLAEAKLFGTLRGSYTGAEKNIKGAIEGAHQGTLVLNEVDTLSREFQAKLLDFLDRSLLFRIGDNIDGKPVDVMVIATANVNLRKQVEDGSFRRDLFARISEQEIDIKPLRDRPEDIEYTTRSILHDLKKKRNIDLDLCFETFDLFKLLHWPENIRSLEKVLVNIALIGGPNPTYRSVLEIIFDPDHPLLPSSVNGRFRSRDKFVKHVLYHTKMNRTLTRQITNVSRPTINKLIKENGWSLT